MNGWHLEITPGAFAFDVALISGLFVVAAWICRQSTLLQRFLIPASLVAGFLGFAFGPAVLDFVPFAATRMSFYVYHLLALTFIVVGLRTPRSKAGADAVHVGFVKTVSIIVQALVGLGILSFFHQFVDPSISPAVGMLLPLGFGMGPGIALSIGSAWELLGVAGAADAGLAIATAGFVFAYVIGVWAVNKGVRDGLVEVDKSPATGYPLAEAAQPLDIASEEPGSDSRPISIVLSLGLLAGCIVIVYAATYAAMAVATRGMEQIGLSAEVPVLWSLNFLWANLVAMLFRKTVASGPFLWKVFDQTLMDKTVAILADLLVATAVMAITMTLAKSYLLPLALSCVAGAWVTYHIVRSTTRWAFHDYAFTRFAGLFGEQTGTMSSGLALIRILDPAFRTPVARDQVLGSGTALVLGFPLLLLINLPLTRFGGSAFGFTLVAGLLVVYLLATIVGWRLFHRRSI